MNKIKKIRNYEKSFVSLYSFIDILDINKQVSYSGYYSSLPSLRLQFDSEYLLNLLSYGVTVTQLILVQYFEVRILVG
jgi:hypothetical protein